jgi:hypothetical protein
MDVLAALRSAMTGLALGLKLSGIVEQVVGEGELTKPVGEFVVSYRD